MSRKRSHSDSTQLKETIEDLEEEEEENIEESYVFTGNLGQPSSHCCFLLSQQLNKANELVLWLAATGAYFQYSRFLLTDEDYKLLVHEYSSFASSLSSKSYIELGIENDLFLNRHIPLYTSLVYSDNISCAYGLSKQFSNKSFDSFTNSLTYKVEGTYQLNLLLAKIGFTKDTCQEIATESLQNRLITSLESKANLKEFSFHAFKRKLGFGESLSTTDMSILSSALLSSEEEQKNGIDFIITDEMSFVERGIELAVEVRRVICSVVSKVLASKLVKSAGDFRYVLLKNILTEEAEVLQHYENLIQLGHFLMKYNAYKGKWTDLNFKPLVLSIRIEENSAEESVKSNLFVACESSKDVSFRKQYFRSAFVAAAEKENLEHKLQGFNFPAIVINNLDQESYLAALHDTVLDIV